MTYDCDDDSRMSADSAFNIGSKRDWRYQVADFCSELSDENLGGKATFITYRAKPNRFDMVAAVDDIQPFTPSKIVKRIEKYLNEQCEQGEYIMENVKVLRFEEITVTQFGKICDQANRADYIQEFFRIVDSTGINCLNNDSFKLTEKICSALGNNNTIFTYGFSSFICANLINNIPMSMFFVEILNNLSTNLTGGVFASIIGSNIGAYLSPIGALAGIMWLKILKNEDIEISFTGFVKYGLMISLPVILVALISLSVSLSLFA